MGTDTPAPRQQVRAWVAEQIAEQHTVNLPALTEQAAEHFARDRAFVKSVLREALYTWVYEQARLVLKRSRESGSAAGGEPIQLGDVLVDRAGYQEHVAARRSRFAAFLERAGDSHYRLLRMTREQLAEAIAAREQQIATSQTYIRLFRRLRDQLRPGQTVGERFTPDQIEAIYQSIGTGDTADSGGTKEAA